MKKILLALIITITVISAAAQFEDFTNALGNQQAPEPVEKPVTEAPDPLADMLNNEITQKLNEESKQDIASNEINDIFERKLNDQLTDKLNNMLAGLENKVENITITDKNGPVNAIQQRTDNSYDIILEEHPIKRIYLENITKPKKAHLKIDSPHLPRTLQSFAIDPELVDFKAGYATITAKGNVLYKCPKWNYKNETCEKECTINEENETDCTEWIRYMDLIPGQNYTIRLAKNDPAFYETSESADIAMTAMDEDSFIIAFVDRSQSHISAKIMNTNGIVELNTIDLDMTADNKSRVDAAAINSTHFVIAWIDGVSQSANARIISKGSIITAIPVDTKVASNTDISIAPMGDRFTICYANDDDNDADYKIYNIDGTQAVGETNVDNNMAPEATLQNLVSCSGINNTRWTYNWFDDASNEIAYTILTNTAGTYALGTRTSAGETAQTATAATNDRFIITWYDSANYNIHYKIISADNNIIANDTIIDANAGTSSRIAAAVVKTDSQELFAIAWQDNNESEIKAALYTTDGEQYTAPFTVTNAESATNQIIGLLGYSPITNTGICTGTFIIAYSNSTGSQFKGFNADGTSWDGNCMGITPTQTGQNYYINDTAILEIQARRIEITGKIFANITLPNGSIETIQLQNTTPTTYQHNYSNLDQKGRYNMTYYLENNNITLKTASSYFNRLAYKTVDITNENSTFLNYTISTTSNNSGILNLTINIDNPRIKQINITNFNESASNGLVIGDLLEENETPTDNYLYYIDPTALSANNLTITTKATGSDYLYKCAEWNRTDETCYGNWTVLTKITRGEQYSITINATDPAFYESSASIDVSVDPINYTTFIVAFVDYQENDTSFRIMDTNGTIIVNTTDVDTNVNHISRVAVAMTNSTHFAIAWINPITEIAYTQIWKFDGTSTTNTTAPIQMETRVGLFDDVKIAAQQGIYDVCFTHDQSNDYKAHAYNSTTGALINTWTVDSNMQPEANLQNLLDCKYGNSTRLVHFFFDDRTVNDATMAIRTERGDYIISALDIDTDVGETAQVANTGLNKNSSALVWYDSTSDNIQIAGVNISGYESTYLPIYTFGPTIVDTNAGNESRVTAATIRTSNTTTEDLFIFSWRDQNSSDIKTAVYNWTGTQITAPYTVTTAVNNTYQLMSIAAHQPITNLSICPGTYVIAYTNSSGISEFKWLNYDGSTINSTQDDICHGRGKADLIPINISFSNDNPNEYENITINGTILNNGTGAAANFIVQFFADYCNGTQIGTNQTVTVLLGGANITLNVTYNATRLGPNNITVCVVGGNVPETNTTNNNLSRELNVKSNQINYGWLTGNLTLDTSQNETVYDWNLTPGNKGYVYFTNSNATINFSKLYPIGRNITGQNTTNDFHDINVNLAIQYFNDSVKTLWAYNASTPRQTMTFTIFGKDITGIPVINSTSTNNFVTGILWDATKDTDGEYSQADKEDLVFVGNININQTGAYGTYDYEAKVPVKLRTYNYNTSLLKFYVELR